MSRGERVLITGVCGQDGSHLARRLLTEGSEVHGLARSPSDRRAPPDVVVHGADATHFDAVDQLVEHLRPTHCFHLAAHHGPSEASARSSADDREIVRANLDAAHALLDAVRRHAHGASVVLAGSCQMFGQPERAPQSETTPVAPRNAYAIAKAAAYHLGAMHRERYGARVSTAILYQHESPLRKAGFLSRRIALGVAAIARGKEQALEVGNLDAIVDWTWVDDACDALVRMARADAPRDYVVARGEPATVRDIVELAFQCVELDWRAHVRANPGLIRPAPRVPYVGDSTAIRRDLGWRPAVDLRGIVERLVEAAMAAEAGA